MLQTETGTGAGGGGSLTTRPPVLEGRIGDPRALGLAAFATTTFIFGLSQTTIWPAGAVSVLSLALAYGGAIQILAGIWAFARHLTFAATVFCSFGAFYVSYYVLIHQLVPGLRGTDLTDAVGVFLLAWLIFSSYVFLASLGVSGTAAAVYFFWTLTYLLLVIGTFLPNTNVIIGGGAAGVATAGLAWYSSAAFLLKETFRKEVLPLLAIRRQAAA